MSKLKDISFKLAYDHYEAESCKSADADLLALAIRKALEEERERCARIAERAIDYRVVAKAIREG